MSHLTIAASEDAFEQLFILVRDNLSVSDSDSGNFGPFSASYSIAFHLENGAIDLRNDGSIEITALDVVWDTLQFQVCFNIPGFCTPSFCIVPDPWNGCLVGIPSICIGGPVCIPLDLSGLVSEVNKVRAHLKAKYFVDPGRLATWSDLDAEFNNKPNKWQIFIDPDHVSVDPIDLPATIANTFENLVEQAIEDMLPGWVPGWAVDLIFAFIGPIVDLVVGILGIVDSIEDFLQDLLENVFGFLSLIQTAIADHFAKKHPIYWFEDPYPILEGTPSLIPVKLPLRNLTAEVNSKEMIVTADIGAP